MDDKLIEILARAFFDRIFAGWSKEERDRFWPLHKEEYMEHAKATIKAEQAAGYRTVPYEPTEEMKIAGWSALMPTEDDCLLGDAYRAMLDAAGGDDE